MRCSWHSKWLCCAGPCYVRPSLRGRLATISKCWSANVCQTTLTTCHPLDRDQCELQLLLHPAPPVSVSHAPHPRTITHILSSSGHLLDTLLRAHPGPTLNAPLRKFRGAGVLTGCGSLRSPGSAGHTPFRSETPCAKCQIPYHYHNQPSSSALVKRTVLWNCACEGAPLTATVLLLRRASGSACPAGKMLQFWSF